MFSEQQLMLRWARVITVWGCNFSEPCALLICIFCILIGMSELRNDGLLRTA